MREQLLVIVEKQRAENKTPASERYVTLLKKYNLSFVSQIQGGTLEETCDFIENHFTQSPSY
jgi:hypothetical protein